MGYRTDILGWMTENELQTLEKIAQAVPLNGNIVEVGSMFGRSAVCWAMSADPSVKIVCIDWFQTDMVQHHNVDDDICLIHSFPLSGAVYNVEEAFIKHTKDFPNIKMLKGHSPTALGSYVPDPIDLFFLDAAHTNPSDWENLCYFIPFIKEGGLICGHDYGNECPHVAANVAKLERILGTTVTLHPGGLLWSIRVDKKINVMVFGD